MSSEELKFVNAFVGFFIPSLELWPAPFQNDDFSVNGIEYPIFVTVGGKAHRPTPELIMTSGSVQHCILLEAKSGSASTTQARSYAAVTPSELVGQGLADADVDEANAKLDVIYICNFKNYTHLSADLGRSNLEFPIVTYGESIFQLAEGTLSSEKLHEVFVMGIDTNGQSWPSHYVQCHSKSDPGDLAATVMKHAVAQLLAEDLIDIENLCAVSVDFWLKRGSDNKKVFRERISEILTEASLTELQEYFMRQNGKKGARVWVRRGNKKWSSASLDKLSDSVENFIQRLQDEREFRKDQPPLLRYVDQA